MRRLLTLLLVLGGCLCAGDLNTSLFYITSGNGSPSNPCSANRLYIQLDAASGSKNWVCSGGTWDHQVGGSGGGAPTGASYWTAKTEAGLSGNVNLGALATGLVKITVSGGTATPSNAVAADVVARFGGCSGVLVLSADGNCHIGGGSVFTGSGGTNGGNCGATPTFDLGDLTGSKSPVHFKCTLNAAITGITILNKSNGAKFDIAFIQPASGGPFAVSFGGAAQQTCAVTQTVNVRTTQSFYVDTDGTTVIGRGDCDDTTVGEGITMPSVSGGSLKLKPAPGITANRTITFPDGSIDFTATGGSSMFVRQNLFGGPLELVRPACADLSDSGPGCSGAGGGSGVGRTVGSVTFSSSLADGVCADQTFTWTGVTTSDTVIAGWPASLAVGLTPIAFVSSANTILVRVCNLTGAPATPGTLSIPATLAIYNLSGAGTIDFASIPDGTCLANTFTLTGVAAGDPVAAQWPSALETGLSGSMKASATNTIQVSLCNYSGGPLDPASHSYGAAIAK